MEIAPPPSRRPLYALQAGALLIVLVVLLTPSFDLDRYFVPKELVLHLTVLIAGLYALPRVRQTPTTLTDVALVVFLGFSVVSAAFATNLWFAFRALAITVSGLGAFWIARSLRQHDEERPLLAALGVGVVLVAITALAQAYGVESAFFPDTRSPGGTLGNRNFIGHLCALGLPLVLLSALGARRWVGFGVGAMGLMPLAAALVLTRSRAAWLALVAVSVVIGLGLLASPTLRRHGPYRVRALLLAGLVGLGLGTALLLPNALEWNSDSPYLDSARDVINYREGSGAGRLAQYEASLDLLDMRPLFGVGPGNWTVRYAEVAPTGDPSLSRRVSGMTTNPWPSSDWVALVTERGWIGLMALIGVFTLLIWSAVRQIRAAETPDTKLHGLILLATLTGTVVVGAFDAVMLLSWPTLYFWTAAGALLTPKPSAAVPLAGWGRHAMLVGILAISGLAVLKSAGQTAALLLYDAGPAVTTDRWATRLDPGNYRAHVRLAQARALDREERCAHAHAAQRLFPASGEARQLARRCR